jgi:acylaminoacyl-peptidase
LDLAWFGGISWSPDENVLIYTAQVNNCKTSSFFATPKATTPKATTTTTTTTTSSIDETVVVVGGQHVLGVGKSEDWGEKYTTTSLLGLFCINIITGKVGRVTNVPGYTTFSTINGYVLGQPIFTPCGTSIVYTAWDAGGGDNMPRRLGAIYCYHRACKLYTSCVTKLLHQLATNTNNNDDDDVSVGKDTSFICITPNDKLARSPRFSKPNSFGISTLVYLCNTNGFDTHGGCMALHSAHWDVSTMSLIVESRKVVVDVVQLPGDVQQQQQQHWTWFKGRKSHEGGGGNEVLVSGIEFPGLFVNQLRDDCFSPDGEYIVTTTEWGSVNKIVSISLVDGTVRPINFDLAAATTATTTTKYNDSACQQFLCFTNDGSAIVTQSEPNRPAKLGRLLPTFIKDNVMDVSSSQLLADMSSISSTSFSSLQSQQTDSTSTTDVNFSSGYTYQLMNTWPEHGNIKVPVASILLLPDCASSSSKVPLIVIPHGGPHTCMSTAYIPSHSYLVKHGGYAVLLVNYRGSTGFGQAALESLTGNAGTQDVLDVVSATQSVIDTLDIIDSDRVGICGGSHGGFLAGHCIGQFPDLFKVAAMRNPCTNLASMVTSTDIPDWVYVESFGTKYYNFANFRPPNRDEVGIMWDKSPIAHLNNVKAPTLMAIGMKDRRVPPSQGLEYYHALRAKGVPTKLLVYDDCDHAIDLVASEADHWINTLRWFKSYL